MRTWKASDNDSGRTIIKFIQKMYPDLPYTKIQKILRKKEIKINGKRIKDGKIVIKKDDLIQLYGSIHTEGIKKKVSRAKITFTTIYEDANVLIVDKPTSVAIHGEKDCLDHQVKTYLNFEQTDSFQVSHISRIDKAASGLVVYAKTYPALRELTSKTRYFKKKYLFVSNLNQSQVVNIPLAQDSIQEKMVVDKAKGKEAITKFVVTKARKYAIIKTGRKHQIRATLAYLGFPILGDRKYGGTRSDRLYLHAFEIQFANLEGEVAYLNGQNFQAPTPFGD